MKSVKTLFFILALAVIGLSAHAQQKDEMTASGAPTIDLVKSVSIFPNPAIEYLNVKFENPIARKAKLTVHNVIGNAVEVESETIDEYEIRLKVRDLPVGYYLLAVRDGESNSRSTIKFLKR
ncbi:MAG: T9SS type A sorting domain-containing protein [Bacteroidota bacterium]